MNTPVIPGLDCELLGQFTEQHASNIAAHRGAKETKGLTASLISRTIFTSKKRLEMSPTPGLDLHGMRKESRAHFTSRKVWSA